MQYQHNQRKTNLNQKPNNNNNNNDIPIVIGYTTKVSQVWL